MKIKKGTRKLLALLVMLALVLGSLSTGTTTFADESTEPTVQGDVQMGEQTEDEEQEEETPAQEEAEEAVTPAAANSLSGVSTADLDDESSSTYSSSSSSSSRAMGNNNTTTVTVTLYAQSYEYTGSAVTYSVDNGTNTVTKSGMGGGNVSFSNLSYTLSYYSSEQDANNSQNALSSAPSDAGTYYVRLALSNLGGRDSYSLSSSSTVVTTLTITQKTITLSFDNATTNDDGTTLTTFAYNESISYTASASGVVDGGSVTVNVAYYSDANCTQTLNLSDVAIGGTYYAQASINETNYTADAIVGTFTYAQAASSYVTFNADEGKGWNSSSGKFEFTYTGNKVFDESAITLSSTLSDGKAPIGALSFSYSGTTNAGEAYSDTKAPVEAGSYTVTVTKAATTADGGYDYYETASASFSIEISKANTTTQLSLPDLLAGSVVYNQAAIQASTTVSMNSEEVEGAEISYSYQAQTSAEGDEAEYGESVEGLPTAVGTYKVTATYAGDGNHNGSSDSAVVTITKADISFSISLTEGVKSVSQDETGAFTYTYVYDGTGKEASVSVSEYYTNDGVTASVSYTKDGTPLEEGDVPTTVGTYTATIVVSGSNYNIYTVDYTIVIVAKEIAVPAADDTTYTYNASSQTYRIAESSEYSVDGNVKTDAGEYTVTVSLTDKENTVWSGAEDGKETADIEYTFVINKATYDMSNVSFDDLTVAYSGSEQSITVTGTVPDGVEVSYENNAGTTPGEYSATASFAVDGNNYNTIEDMTAVLTITKFTPVLTIDLTDGENTLLADGAYVLTYGDSYEMAYVITLAGDDSLDNYTITPSVVYTYYTSAENAENDIDGTTTQPTDAGTYYVKATISTSSSDYSSISDALSSLFGSLLNGIANAMGTGYYAYYTTDSESTVLEFTIVNADPVVTAVMKSKQLTYGDDYEVTSTVELKNDEEYTGNVIYTYYYASSDVEVTNSDGSVIEPVDVGSYYVVASISAQTNYNAAESSKLYYTISEKDIDTSMFTVKQDNDTLSTEESTEIVYTGSAITPTVGSNLTLNVDYTVTYSEDPVNVGNYTVTIKGINNYTGTLTYSYEIINADLTVAASGYEGVYDADSHTISVSAKESGAVITYSSSSTGDYSEDEISYKDAGEYTVYYKVELANYNTVTGSETIIISKAALSTVITKSSSTTWTGSGIEAVADSVTGFKGNETEDTYGGKVSRTYYVVVGGEYTELSSNDEDYIDSETGTPYAVGEYKYVVSASDCTNYTGASAETTFTISARSVSMTATFKGDTTYNAKAYVPVPLENISVTDSYANEALTLDESDITYIYQSVDENGDLREETEETPVNAGKYKVTVIFSRTGYTSSSISFTYTIDKAETELKWTTETSSKTYDGSAATAAAAEVTGLQGEDKETAVVTYYQYVDSEWESIGESVPTNAGTYKVVASYDGSDNYNAAESIEIEFNIAKAAPTISVSDKSTTYSYGTSVSVNNASVTLVNNEKYRGEVTYTYYSDEACETIIATVVKEGMRQTSSSGTLPTNAGTYYVVVSIAEQDNYNSATATATITISKATIKSNQVSESNYSGTYDSNAHSASVSVNTSGRNAVEGGSFTVTYSYDGEESTNVVEFTNAGEYTVSYVITDANGNYNDYSGTLSVVINKANTSLSWTVKAESKIYDTTAVKASASLSTIYGNDTESATITYYNSEGEELESAPVNAGTYTVKATFEGSDNYNAAGTISTEFTISKATPGIAIEGKTVDYNGYAVEYAAAEAKVTLLGEDSYSEDEISYTYYNSEGEELESAPKDAGSYTVKATIAESANYEAATSEGVTLTINKVDPELEFTTIQTSATYAEDYTEAEAKVTLKGEDEGEATIVYYYLNSDLTLGDALDGAPSDTGVYMVVASYGGDEDTNYNYAEISEKIIIDPAAISVVVTTDGALEAAYSAKEYAPVSVESDTEGAVITYSYTGTTNAGEAYESEEAPVEAGSYTVSIAVSAVNYTDYKDSYDFVITKAATELSWTAVPANKAYDGEASNEAEANISGLIGEDTAEISISYYVMNADGEWEAVEETPVEAGTYMVVAEYKGTDNYAEAESISYIFKIATISGNAVTGGNLNAVTNVSNVAAELLGSDEADDEALIEAGCDIEYVVSVSAADPSDEEIEAITAAAGDDLEVAIFYYMDITLTKVITDLDGNETEVAVSNAKTSITVTIPIPESMLEEIEASGVEDGTFAIIRMHDGVAEVLEVIYDADAQTITFETDKFSTYAISYTKEAEEEEKEVEEVVEDTSDDDEDTSNDGEDTSDDNDDTETTTTTSGTSTGDSRSLLLWEVLLTIAIVGIAIIVGVESVKRRRRR